MKFYIIFLLTFVFFLPGISQDFEGKIDLVRKTLSDTSYLTYTIKGDQVRIDEYDKYKRLHRYYLVNLSDYSVFIVNPNRQMYTSLTSDDKTSRTDNNSGYEIIKSNNHKEINGYICYQWRVRNRDQNTEISYWVTGDNFVFFTELLKAWNSSDKNGLFYLMIPDSNGRIPMLAVERTLLRDEKNRLAVTQISDTGVEDSIFTIPETFKNLQQVR